MRRGEREGSRRGEGRGRGGKEKDKRNRTRRRISENLEGTLTRFELGADGIFGYWQGRGVKRLLCFWLTQISMLVNNERQIGGELDGLRAGTLHGRRWPDVGETRLLWHRECLILGVFQVPAG